MFRWAWSLVFLLVVPVVPVAHAADAAADAWRPVERLVGDWRGSSTGEAGSAEVVRSYRKLMNGRYLQETHTSTYPPQPRNPKGEVHEHLSLISHDRQRQTLVLRQFHIEGFVNTYRLSAEPAADGKLVFESEHFENFSNAWKARETYEFTGDDQVVETFELAPPGKPFQVYSRTELRRAR